MENVKEGKKEWKKIWESRDCKAGIYDNCSTRVYRKEGRDKLKIEVDGTKFVESDKLEKIIEEYDNDESSNDDVSDVIYLLTGC